MMSRLRRHKDHCSISLSLCPNLMHIYGVIRLLIINICFTNLFFNYKKVDGKLKMTSCI